MPARHERPDHGGDGTMMVVLRRLRMKSWRRGMVGLWLWYGWRWSQMPVSTLHNAHCRLHYVRCTTEAVIAAAGARVGAR